MNKVVYVVFLLIFLGVIIPLFFFHPSYKEELPSPSVEKIGKLDKILFTQFRKGKKIWELSAESMEEKNGIIFLSHISGYGITKDKKRFSFKADKIELDKKNYSFIAYGNVEFFVSNREIFGKKMVYDAEKDVYTLFHGIIYIKGKKVSIKGDQIVFYPSSSRLIVGGIK